MAAGRTGRRRRTLTRLYPSLAIPAQRRLMLGVIPNLFAFQLGVVVTGVAAVRLADSAFIVGLVVGAWGLPILILPPVGGALADRIRRRRIMIGAQLVLGGAALVVAVLAANRVLEAWQLVVLGLVQGVVYAFYAPARTAYMAVSVGPARLPDAVAVYGLGEYVAAVSGPLAAGLLLAGPGIGIEVGYALIATIHACVALVFSTLPAQEPEPGADQRLFQAVGAGIRYAGATPVIRRLLLLAALTMLLAMPYQRLMPVFADNVLGVGSAGLGLLVAASGLGSILGALLVPRRRRGQAGPDPAADAASPPTPVLPTTILAGAFGAAVIVFALAPGFTAAVGLAVVTGAAAAAFLSAKQGRLVATAAPRMVGRVASLNQLTYGFGPLGAIPIAALADAAGPRVAIALGGTLLVAAAAILHAGRPTPAAGARPSLEEQS